MNEQLQKAFALACRILADYSSCPAEVSGGAWEMRPGCENDEYTCVNMDWWSCWQNYLLNRVQNEYVCRSCGCTQDRACEGGCSWVKEDLCSRCVAKSRGGE